MENYEKIHIKNEQILIWKNKSILWQLNFHFLNNLDIFICGSKAVQSSLGVNCKLIVSSQGLTTEKEICS